MKEKIKVAIVGVGNCAKSLIEGVALYAAEDLDTGLMFKDIGGYTAKEIEFVAAFDVDYRKIGQHLFDAIYELPNSAMHLYCVSSLDEACSAIVQPAPLLDGVAAHMRAKNPSDRERFFVDGVLPAPDVELFAKKLQNVDVLLNYLPVGSDEATRFWADVCIRAGVNMVNCIPSFIASDKDWARKFEQAGVTIIGDDMRSQVGASIISAALQELFLQRGADVEVHHQNNIGGNTDFLNMQDQNRLASKKISKENVIRKQNELRGLETKENTIAAGPAKYFTALGDNKRADFLIKGTVFGGAPFEFTAHLSVQDSPNSAGVVIDAIRLVKVANELGIVGPVIGPSAATQKTPSVDMFVKDAHAECSKLADREIPEGYIERNGKFVHSWVNKA